MADNDPPSNMPTDRNDSLDSGISEQRPGKRRRSERSPPVGSAQDGSMLPLPTADAQDLLLQTPFTPPSNAQASPSLPPPTANAQGLPLQTPPPPPINAQASSLLAPPSAENQSGFLIPPPPATGPDGKRVSFRKRLEALNTWADQMHKEIAKMHDPPLAPTEDRTQQHRRREAVSVASSSNSNTRQTKKPPYIDLDGMHMLTPNDPPSQYTHKNHPNYTPHQQQHHHESFGLDFIAAFAQSDMELQARLRQLMKDHLYGPDNCFRPILKEAGLAERGLRVQLALEFFVRWVVGNGVEEEFRGVLERVLGVGV